MTTSRRSITNALAIGLVAVLGVSACTSDPSAVRVAEDLVKTVAQDFPDIEACMLDVIDDYDDEFGLNTLGSDARSGNEEVSAPAIAILDDFESDLAACDPEGVTRTSTP